jgi:hypothetical protein
MRKLLQILSVGFVLEDLFLDQLTLKDNLQFAAVERASPGYLSVDVSVNIIY